MPKPVHKPKGTDTESLVAWALRESPATLAEFEAGYEDALIVGGECRRCYAHVIENKQGHQDWHKSISFGIWVMGSAYQAMLASHSALEEYVNDLTDELREVTSEDFRDRISFSRMVRNAPARP